MTTPENIHTLRRLILPDRFETLYALIGGDVARILVKPPEEFSRAFETTALAVTARGEGLYLPLSADSGTGKTTLAQCLSSFFPSAYTSTISHTGPIDYESLVATIGDFVKTLPTNDGRAIPVNVDHRESNPPSPPELAAIKRFLRKPSLGSRSVVLWPETSVLLAQEMSDRYITIAGKQPIPLPIHVEGPLREAWRDIATNTLELANGIAALADLGVDPAAYDPAEFPTIGAFLRQISNAFTANLQKMLAAERKPITLAIVFATGSAEPGVLAQLTNPSHYGMLNAHALLDATKDSVIGRWWAQRRGLLTQTILQLNAHVFCMQPAATLGALARYAESDVHAFLAECGVRNRGSRRVNDDLERTDLGKFLRGTARAAFEGRGTPAAVSTPAFQKLVEKFGLTHGRDKRFNRALAAAWMGFWKEHALEYENVTSEEKLSFCSLIPDNAIVKSADVLCIEYAWRSGDYLVTANRSSIAQYLLTKLRNYAREMGWMAD